MLCLEKIVEKDVQIFLLIMSFACLIFSYFAKIGVFLLISTIILEHRIAFTI